MWNSSKHWQLVREPTRWMGLPSMGSTLDGSITYIVWGFWMYYMKKFCSFPCNECVSYSQKRDILQSPSLSWISWFAFYEKFYNSPWTCTSSNCMPSTRGEGLFIQGGLLGFEIRLLWSLPTLTRWEHSVKEAKLCNHTAQHICTIHRSETLTNKRTWSVVA